MTPPARATSATIIFSVFGAVAAVFFVHDWATAWPFAAIYAVNVYNTYFSVRYFSAIISPDMTMQKMIDTLLLLVYAAAAAAMNYPAAFALSMTSLCALAAMKYAVALPAIAEPRHLYRKIKINIFATIGGLIALAGILAGHEEFFSLLFALSYIVAIIYILFIKPLYVLQR